MPAAALRGERLLTLGKGHQLFESARDLAAASGADMREDYEGTSLDALWQMVLMGMGVSLFPELYALSELREGDSMVLLRLEGWAARRAMGYFWRAQQRPRGLSSSNWRARARRRAPPSASPRASRSERVTAAPALARRLRASDKRP